VICDAPLVATLTKHRITDAMPTITTTTRDDWPPERLDRLARGMFAVLYGRPAPAPAPAPANVVILADYRRPAPCPD
jgi:hypothetical protein